MKVRITTHSKYRYKAGPTVHLTFKLAAREHLSSGLIRSFFAGILSYVKIPSDTRSLMVSNLTVSFSKRSVGDLLCNFRISLRRTGTLCSALHATVWHSLIPWVLPAHLPLLWLLPMALPTYIPSSATAPSLPPTMC
jgi:hypothetical protein